jgi:RNA polymerase sigma-70 factor, ECF subfamily
LLAFSRHSALRTLVGNQAASMSDRSSIGRSSDGSTSLLEAQIPDLRRFARALVRGDRDRADDLVQDALERALSHWHQRRREGSLRNWLYAILYNRFLTECQRSLRRNFWIRSLTPIAEEDLPMIDARQTQALAYRDFLRGFAALPAEQRAVLFVVGVENMSYAEAAAVLNIPMGTVMSRLSRGRQSLRNYMEGDEDQIRSPRQSAKPKPCVRAVRELEPT